LEEDYLLTNGFDLYFIDRFLRGNLPLVIASLRPSGSFLCAAGVSTLFLQFYEK
jgi:hypothetical protein|tara:strand:+ start:28 stop:189 length:162 start_codon:yes stop_codon:yes gene_type:complete